MYFVLVFHTKKQEISEGKKGAPASYMVAREAGVTKGAGRRLAWPQSRGGATPLFLFSEEVTWEQGKVVAPWKTIWGEGWGSRPWRLSSGLLHPLPNRTGQTCVDRYLILHLPQHKFWTRHLPSDPQNSFENKSISSLTRIDPGFWPTSSDSYFEDWHLKWFILWSGKTFWWPFWQQLSKV